MKSKGRIIESKLDNNFYITSGNMLAKFDHVGKLIWTSGYERIDRAILQNETGEIFCGGSSGFDGFHLTKFDTSGNFIWQKKYNQYAFFSAF